MNLFRLTGDLSHLLAILVLLWKIWKTRSCAGKFWLVLYLQRCVIPYLKGRFGFQSETSFSEGSIDYHLISSCVILILPSSHSGVFGLIVRDYEVALNPSAMYSEFCTRVTSPLLGVLGIRYGQVNPFFFFWKKNFSDCNKSSHAK